MAEEVKEIGVPIDLTGTFSRTEISDGKLKLQVEKDIGNGEKTYYESGYWISKITDLGDKFKNFEKLFIDSVSGNNSSFTVQTRSSSNAISWSVWSDISSDGTIQSPASQYIQIRINLFAGAEIATIFLPHSEYLANNDYIESKLSENSGYKIPQLTSNTSSNLGIAFTNSFYAVANEAWKAFDKTVGSIYASATANINNGFIGFLFKESKIVNKYKVNSTSTASLLNTTIKDFVFEASKDTTNGSDGIWKVLDERSNQAWTANQQREYEIANKEYFKGYRIRWTANNGGTTYTSINELDFFSPQVNYLVLKRDYSFDMTVNENWSEEGSLHRQRITRDKWLRIDKLNVLESGD